MGGGGGRRGLLGAPVHASSRCCCRAGAGASRPPRGPPRRPHPLLLHPPSAPRPPAWPHPRRQFEGTGTGAAAGAAGGGDSTAAGQRCGRHRLDLAWMAEASSSVYATPLITDLHSDGRRDIIVPSFVHYLEVRGVRQYGVHSTMCGRYIVHNLVGSTVWAVWCGQYGGAAHHQPSLGWPPRHRSCRRSCITSRCCVRGVRRDSVRGTARPPAHCTAPCAAFSWYLVGSRINAQALEAPLQRRPGQATCWPAPFSTCSRIRSSRAKSGLTPQ